MVLLRSEKDKHCQMAHFDSYGEEHLRIDRALAYLRDSRLHNENDRRAIALPAL